MTDGDGVTVVTRAVKRVINSRTCCPVHQRFPSCHNQSPPIVRKTATNSHKRIRHLCIGKTPHDETMGTSTMPIGSNATIKSSIAACKRRSTTSFSLPVNASKIVMRTSLPKTRALDFR